MKTNYNFFHETVALIINNYTKMLFYFVFNLINSLEPVLIPNYIIIYIIQNSLKHIPKNILT